MNKTRHAILFRLMLALSLCTVLLSACNQTAPTTATATQAPTPTPPPTPTQIERDYWPTDGWRISTPEEQGLDSEQLAEIIDYLQGQNSIDIHSLMIIRNGYIVTDTYFYPFAQDSLHDLASATKSFTSTLIGIAIDKGTSKTVGHPAWTFSRSEPWQTWTQTRKR